MLDMSVIGSFQVWRSKQALNHWVLHLARQGREEKPEIVFYGREKNRGSARLGAPTPGPQSAPAIRSRMLHRRSGAVVKAR